MARQELAALIIQAANDGAQLIVCPEMATTGYVWESQKELMPHAEAENGPTAALLSKLALDFNVWIVCGYAEICGEALYNSALLIGPDGSVLGSYRKILLYTSDFSWAKSGNVRMSLNTGFGDICPGICMDINDDNFILHLWRTKPSIVAFCTNWIDDGSDVIPYWKMRLWGWKGWFVAANTWGEEDGVRFSGESAIVDPNGNVLARAEKTGNQVISCVINDVV